MRKKTDVWAEKAVENPENWAKPHRCQLPCWQARRIRRWRALSGTSSSSPTGKRRSGMPKRKVGEIVHPAPASSASFLTRDGQP